VEKSLFKNKWIEVVEMDDWYTVHKPTYNGVSVLVYDELRDLVLMRYEHTPPHGPGVRATSITGMIDGFPELLDEQTRAFYTAQKELWEEAGLELASIGELQFLGTAFPGKGSPHLVYLFALRWDSARGLAEPTGDGTKGEVGAYVKWMTRKEAVQSDNLIVAASVAKLMYHEGR